MLCKRNSVKNIIIVSKCTKEILPKKNGDTHYPYTFEFHFKGVFAGDLLKKVRLTHIRKLEVGKTEFFTEILIA
jgi:hypothetical protein